MENPYGHDHSCNLMTTLSERVRGRRQRRPREVDRRRELMMGGMVRKDGDSVLTAGGGDFLSSGLTGWC